MSKTIYYYLTTSRVGRQLVPAASLFDGPDEGDPWLGEIKAKDEDTLTRILNGLEGAVELED